MIPFKLFSIFGIVLCIMIDVCVDTLTISDTCISKVPSTKVSKDQPKPDQRSLLLIFDTTGSMGGDLEQMKAGAREIVLDFSSRSNNPIYNYILVAFDDPGVGIPYTTTNVNELLQRLTLVQTVSSNNPDCPELAMGGLKAGLKIALPNSIVYLFTDAAAKDYYLYNEVEALILKKQITVNFLVSNGCIDSKSNEMYLVYHKVSRISNGQVYEMEKKNVGDVLSSLRDNINPNYVVLKTYESKNSGQTTVDFDIDSSIYDLKITVSGKNPRLTILNSLGSSVAVNQELALDSIKISSLKNPSKGSWKVQANADTAYNVIISGLSDLKIDFGFSVEPARNISQTAIQPLSGNKNILSLFVSNSSKVRELSDITIFTVPLTTYDSSTEYTFALRKHDDNMYVTDPFEVPKATFKIKMKGRDVDNNGIERIISSVIVSSPGSAPEITIRVNKVEAYRTNDVELQCTVKSLIPVDIAWTFDGKILKELHSVQSNELKLNIQNITSERGGTYKCVTINQVNCETQEIRITVKELPTLSIVSSSTKMIENSSDSLKCQISSSDGQILEYSWMDKNGKILQNGNTYTFVPTWNDHKSIIKCEAKCNEFSITGSKNLDIQFGPKFLTENSVSNTTLKYGTKAIFNCSTFENPSKNSLKWFFTQKGLIDSKLISGESKDSLEVEMYENNEGNYECAISNEVGEARRNFTALVVPIESPKISSSSNIMTANVNNNVEIFCECRDCLPITNYSWTFDNFNDYKIEVVMNEKANYFKTFVSLNVIDKIDSGNFNCQIENVLGQDNKIIKLQVQFPPEINQIILKNGTDLEVERGLEVLEDENLAIECVVDGFPLPKVSWSNDGVDVSYDHMLIVNKISNNDHGLYECSAENLLGKVNKTIIIDVNYTPRRNDETDTIFEVVEGNEVVLDCNLIGHPLPNISWYLNSKKIETNEKFMVGEKALKFKAGSDDSGIYTCNGVNDFGSESLELTVVVKSFPRIFSSNDELVRVENNTCTKLSCDATGYPKPTITFIRNNTLIANETFYQITSATLSDSGNYHCIAENEVGTDEKIFYVTVVKRPLVTSYFNNITLYTNQTIGLTCLAEGIPTPNIKWMFDDKETLSTNATIELDSNSNNGKVSCIAENLEGSDEKYFYLETVNKPNVLSIINDLLRNISIREGGDLDLLCPYENYNFIEWHFNGSALNISEYNQVGRKLYVFNTKRSYSGIWTCVVSNSEGKMDFSYDVNVQSAPVVLASWMFNSSITDFDKNDANIDQKVFGIGENLLLNCTVGGSPVPKVEWRKATDLIGRGEVLMINKLQFYHSDIYSCSAANNQGIVKKYFKIEVLAPPHIDETFAVQKNIYTNIDDFVVLRCSSIIANPEPIFIWFKNNEILEDESKDHLVIEKVALSDEGKYRCTGRNKFGSAKIYFTLNVYEPATVLELIEQEHPENQNISVQLSCISRGFPIPVISWTFNGHILSTTSKVNVDEIFKNSSKSVIYFDGFGNQISSINASALDLFNGNHSSKLTKLDAKTLKLDLTMNNNREIINMRKFGCYTFNALGQNEKTIDITTKHKPFIAKHNMPKQFDYEILEHMPLQLSCLVEGFPKPEITWFIDEHQIFDNDTMKLIDDQRILNIPETFSWNSGNYSCISKNDVGKLEVKYNVLILSPPKVIYSSKTRQSDIDINIDEESIETIYIREGDDASLECMIEASPRPEIYWVKLNALGDEKENIILSEKSNRLTLRAIGESSNYMCHANNTIGYTQKIFQLKIQYPPKLIDNNISDESKMVKLSHSLKLECKVSASPEAITYWSFDSNNITSTINGIFLLNDNQTIRILSASKKHEGKFTCTSVNSLGTTQKNFHTKIDVPVKYLPWSQWSECSEICGSNGTQYRTRTTCALLDASPSYNCSGKNLESRNCNEFPCPINGGFSAWSDWSKCPPCYDILSSEKPKQKRSRTCDSPSPAFGGLICDEAYEETRECEINVCSIDGGWSSWSKLDDCPLCYNSSSSEKPKFKRNRICNSPVPAHGGLDCQGNDTEEEECAISPCPIDGKWNSWSDWSECPACYDALDTEKPKQRRNRTCNSPAPAFGGLPCHGTDIEEQECKSTKICSVDGGWSEWSDWDKCPSCYAYNAVKPKQRRTRACNKPVPAYGGRECQGIDRQEQNCTNIRICPVNGGWSAWSQWTRCPSCNDTINPTKNTRKRYRICNSPVAAYGGRKCSGNIIEEQNCRVDTPCPIDGGWTDWTDWSQCSAKCDKGLNTRIRFCKNPVPKYNGKDCVGDSTQTKPCEIIPCSTITSELNSLNENTEAEIESFNESDEVFSRNSRYSKRFGELKTKPNDINCAQGYMFNLRTNRCDIVNICKDGFMFNSQTRRCEDITKCNKGFLYNSFNHKCEDIDECKLFGKNWCKSNETCINTFGDFECRQIR